MVAAKRWGASSPEDRDTAHLPSLQPVEKHIGEDEMVLQGTEFDATLRALRLDAEERHEVEYHLLLASVVKPVEDARTALRIATAEGKCGEWAATHRDPLARAAEVLRGSRPPTWLAVYRNSFLAAVDLFLQAADCWIAADPPEGDDCAQRAAEAMDSAEDLAGGLL